MSSNFDVNQYWRERGRSYYREDRLKGEYHRRQEQFIVRILREGGVPLGSVLELGCGFGRVTRLLAQALGAGRIMGLDLSPEQLAHAREYCQGIDGITFQPYDFYSGEPFPGGTFDTAVAIEVFLHHPTDRIRTLLERLAGQVQFVVNLDWSEAWPWPLPEHVWLHDYPALFSGIGWDCAAFPLPEKIEGQQQVLYVSGKSLPQALLSIPRGKTAAEESPSSSVDSWGEQVRLALKDVTSVVPAHSRVVLVDDSQWGMPDSWNDLAFLPFTSRDGVFDGPPADDPDAEASLKEMIDGGATHLVLGWNCGWYAETYPQWHAGIRSKHRCLLENNRVQVFKLAP